MEMPSSARSRAACRSRERTRYWRGVTPSTIENNRRKWNGLISAWRAACFRSICRFEEAAAALAAEAALTHIPDRVAAMPLDERRVVRASAAAELGNRNGIALQKRSCSHGRNFTPAGASEQLEAAPRTRSY